MDAVLSHQRLTTDAGRHRECPALERERFERQCSHQNRIQTPSCVPRSRLVVVGLDLVATQQLVGKHPVSLMRCRAHDAVKQARLPACSALAKLVCFMRASSPTAAIEAVETCLDQSGVP